MKLCLFIVFLIFANTAFACLWDFPCDLNGLVVKIQSTLVADPSKKIEGTGLLVVDSRGRGMRVLTAEHVLFPCVNGEAQIKITDTSGITAIGQIESMDWVNGLALLSIEGRDFFQSHKWAPMPPRDRYIRTRGDPKEVYSIHTGGFAHGSLLGSGVSVGGHNYRGRLKKGTILAGSEVYSVSNFRVSPGFSGAPAYDDRNQFAGIVSHLGGESNGYTYVVPPIEVHEWLINKNSNRKLFRRSCSDIILGLDHARQTIVRDDGVKLRLQNKEITVLLPSTNQSYKAYGKDGLSRLVNNMEKSSTKTAKLEIGEPRSLYCRFNNSCSDLELNLNNMVSVVNMILEETYNYSLVDIEKFEKIDLETIGVGL